MVLTQKGSAVYLVFNIKKMNRFFLLFLSLCILIASFLFIIIKPDHFKTESGICVTVKGSLNGCYFIPYEYNSLLPPKTDYIKAKSIDACGLTIYYFSPSSIVVRFDREDMWEIHMSNIKCVIDSSYDNSNLESLYPIVRYIFPLDTYIHPSIAETQKDSSYAFYHF